MNSETHLIRDALQMHLLHSIFRQNVKEALAVKGGIAMKAVFGVDRATKDIDLEASLEFPVEMYRGIIDRAIKESLKIGLLANAVISTPKSTETTTRWKINGVTPQGSPMNLTIEMSRRSQLPRDTVQWTDIPTKENLALSTPAKALTYSPAALAFSKINCLTSELRTAPRDLYDLSVIIKTMVEPPLELLASVQPEELQRQLQVLWPKLEVMSWSLFQNEVLPSLPLEQQTLSQETYETMRLEVGTTIERWLTLAVEAQQKKSNKVGL